MAASAPKSAGRTCLKAGAMLGLVVSAGSTGRNASTPTARITVVVIAEDAIAIVEMTSPSSEFARTPAFSMALSPQGSLRFVMLPVTKLRYVPPAPSMGA